MNEVKKNFSKWMYWFLLAVAIILVYKFLDNFTAIGNAIGKFVGIISPFLAGTLMAYLLYIPASRIEKKLLKSKKKFFKKRARGLSVFITFTFTILLIMLLVNVIFEGMSRLVEENCDFLVSIPMKGGLNSLNASAAAAILLYEAVRQRMG